MKLYFAAFIVAAGLALCKNAPAQNVATIMACPADSIKEWLIRCNVPAAGIGIIENGKIKSIHIYGQLKEGVPAAANSLWNVASLTKPVTALTVLLLVNKGLWNLDEPVAKYWTDPDIKDQPWTAKLTTRLLLSHQSGFPNWRFIDSSKKLNFHFEPGTRMGYSGEGFEYLRRAVEAKSGKSLQQLAKELLFIPLQMNDTRYSWDDQLDSARFAQPHDKTGNSYTYRKNRAINAADWLITSITDYTRFGVFVLNGAGLSKKLYDDMTTIHSHFDTTAANRSNGMGLGWQVTRDLPNGEFALAHSGSDPGIATFILLFPVSKRGIVIFTNGDNGALLRRIILKASHIDLAPALARYMNEFK